MGVSQLKKVLFERGLWNKVSPILVHDARPQSGETLKILELRCVKIQFEDIGRGLYRLVPRRIQKQSPEKT